MEQMWGENKFGCGFDYLLNFYVEKSGIQGFFPSKEVLGELNKVRDLREQCWGGSETMRGEAVGTCSAHVPLPSPSMALEVTVSPPTFYQILKKMNCFSILIYKWRKMSSL